MPNETLHIKPPATRWDGNYRGVYFRISTHRLSEKSDPEWPELTKDNWAFYIYLIERQCPVDYWEAIWLEPKRERGGWLNYPYYACPLADLEWHCGMTWYSKENGPDEEFGIVKAGCDYGHLWDEGYTYSVEGIKREVMACIDSLHEQTQILWRCSACDEYGLPDGTGFVTRDGYFLHSDCVRKQKVEREANAPQGEASGDGGDAEEEEATG